MEITVLRIFYYTVNTLWMRTVNGVKYYGERKRLNRFLPFEFNDVLE
jgi:hypothetical protein